jgi:hypothetical protein
MNAQIPDMNTGRGRSRATLFMAGIVGSILSVVLFAGPAMAKSQVLRVGTYRGVPGQFKTIQAAVDHAKPGDWILIAPGDYHERGDRTHRPKPDGNVPPSAVLIKTPKLHLRGMDRNKVIVDGTKPGSSPCSSKKSAQDFGVKSGSSQLGRNGIVAYKASGVSVENLTACNFLTGSGKSGNELWWNGGDGSGKIDLGRFKGNYLNATSTFYNGTDTAAGYGIFSSNARGPGVWAHDYASNFDDSNYYIGGCRRVCNQVMNHDWSEFSALGYSGTNSGGRLIIKNSEFDNNKDGFSTNSQNNDDWPSPQSGHCRHGKTSPVTHTVSCWAFIHNYVHDNNNPQVPGRGAASAGPVGTGMSIAGGRFDTVMRNRFVHNGAWGVLLVPYPDDETPPPGEHCQGGTSDTILSSFGFTCTFDDWGNQLFHNKFKDNGFFGNPTNGDIGELTLIDGKPINCYQGNTTPDGTSPANVQQTNTNCGQAGTANNNLQLLSEAACDSEVDVTLCLPTDSYPRGTKVVMHPLPTKKLATMPDPCQGVPSNPWCPSTGRQGH